MLQLIVNAILIFFIFFLICILCQFFKFLDHKKDKRNLIKLRNNCPEALIIVPGKVKSSEFKENITIYINGERKNIKLNKDTLDNDMILLYSSDNFNDIISESPISNGISKSFKIYDKEKYYILNVDADGEEVTINSTIEYSKGKKIELVKKLGNDEYLLKTGDENVVSTKDKDIGNDIIYLLKNEQQISKYEDSFNPSLFIDFLMSVGLTLAVVFGLYFLGGSI